MRGEAAAEREEEEDEELGFEGQKSQGTVHKKLYTTESRKRREEEEIELQLVRRRRRYPTVGGGEGIDRSIREGLWTMEQTEEDVGQMEEEEARGTDVAIFQEVSFHFSGTSCWPWNNRRNKMKSMGAKQKKKLESETLKRRHELLAMEQRKKMKRMGAK
ncbi:hypothetical protein TIFTF001_046540 [Ficus carica]|uniref:Uncharacterized protein n=1 Tax=Ficus carica TaxID=3494 RepID=A0AA88CU41_FICCA|nr:hypothetical protein TIFTF001_046540 [Ficus carica]